MAVLEKPVPSSGLCSHAHGAQTYLANELVAMTTPSGGGFMCRRDPFIDKVEAVGSPAMAWEEHWESRDCIFRAPETL